jgi:hypothetical protein
VGDRATNSRPLPRRVAQRLDYYLKPAKPSVNAAGLCRKIADDLIS